MKKCSISVNTEDITMLIRENLEKFRDFRFECVKCDNDEDLGFCELSLKVKIPMSDKWNCSVSRGSGEDKEVKGFGQGNTHQESPFTIVDFANQWIEEGNEYRESRKNVIEFPSWEIPKEVEKDSEEDTHDGYEDFR